MNLIAPDDYVTRLDKHIKDELKNVLPLRHPCEYQNRNCLKGSSCPLIGLPNDTCTFYIRGRCTFDQCTHEHYDLYANAYQRAKAAFKNEEKKPLAMIRRYFNRFVIPLIWFIQFIFIFIGYYEKLWIIWRKLF